MTDLQPTIEVEVSPDPEVISVVVPSEIDVVAVVVEGQQGPRGGDGAGGSRYEHIQTSEAAAWIVNHNLGHFPVISVLTAGGRMMLAAVEHLSSNHARVDLDTPMTGRAICL